LKIMKAIAAILLLLSAASLRAELGCTNSKLVDTNNFFYAVCDVPDIDQRRADSATVTGLPGDGALYCVPAAAMNFFAFLAYHPVAPVPEPGQQAQNWQTSTPMVYNDMTANLELLGSMMGTDPVTGTTGFGGQAGMEQWLDDNGMNEAFLVSLFYAVGTYSPRMTELAQAALDGAYVMPNMGFYTNADDDDEPKTRAGGHVVSLVGAAGDFALDTQVMVMHDPDNMSSWTTQASFFRKQVQTQDVTGTFDGNVRTQSRVLDYRDGSAYIDGYQTIRYNWALILNKYYHYVAAMHPFVHPEDEVTKRYDPVGRVTDLAMHPERTRHPYLVEGSDTVWQLDTLTGESSRLASFEQPKALEFGGGEQSLYLLLKGQLVALDWDGRQKQRVSLREELDQIAWDEKNEQLLGLSLRSGKLLRFDTNLALLGSVDLRAIPGGGKAHMSVAPRTGVVWILREGASAALRLSRDADVVPLEGVLRAESLAVGQNGFVYVNDGGQIVAFDALGRRERRSAFNGLPGGAIMNFARSFSNFDPRIHAGPAWRNVPPPGEEEQ
jgi:hypothetical protein